MCVCVCLCCYIDDFSFHYIVVVIGMYVSNSYKWVQGGGGYPSLFSDHQIDEERFKNVEFHVLSEAWSNLTGFKKYPSQK